MVGIEAGRDSRRGREWAPLMTLAARERGRMSRPIGDVVVLMPPPAMSGGRAAPPRGDHRRGLIAVSTRSGIKALSKPGPSGMREMGGVPLRGGTSLPPPPGGRLILRRARRRGATIQPASTFATTASGTPPLPGRHADRSQSPGSATIPRAAGRQRRTGVNEPVHDADLTAAGGAGAADESRVKLRTPQPALQGQEFDAVPIPGRAKAERRHRRRVDRLAKPATDQCGRSARARLTTAGTAAVGGGAAS